MTSLRPISLALALIGLGIAIYLSVVHYLQGQVPLLCSSTGLVNCEQVTTSPWSAIGPVPVAVLGVVWFVVLLGLFVWPAVNSPTRLLRIGWTLVGLLTVLYLIYAELFLIGSICLWCSAVHLIVIALFVLAMGELSAQSEEMEEFT